tara:strand:- start:1370 stop:2047 length:678 start_codon:yes stop_codon:yes gene_type:complete
MVKQKRRLLVKQMTRIGIIAAVVLAVLGGAYFAISGMASSTEEEMNRLRASIQGDQNQISQLEQLVTDAGLAGEIYAELSLNRDVMTFTIERNQLPDILGKLNDTYFLNEMSLESEPPQTFTNTELGAVKREAVLIDYTLTFTAMSDHIVYSFIDALMRQSPGFIKVTELEVERMAPLDLEALNKISRGEFVPVTKATVGIRWYGFRPVSESDTPQEGSDVVPGT